MPERHASVRLDVAYGKEAFERIQLGLRPQKMEDKWFAYYEEPWLNLHRSWTGNLIYRIRFEPGDGGARAVELEVNQDPRQWRIDTLEREVSEANRLVNGLLAFNCAASLPPGRYLEDDSDPLVLEEWALVGRAMFGQGPRPGHDEPEDGGEGN